VTENMQDAYVVWSKKHGAWWRASRAGYTTDLRQAGVYGQDEAASIADDSRGGLVHEHSVALKLAYAMARHGGMECTQPNTVGALVDAQMFPKQISGTPRTADEVRRLNADDAYAIAERDALTEYAS
jgi:hypothetical protein